MSKKTLGTIAGLGFIGTIFAANWLIVHVGIVHVGFGLVAPAAVLSAGLAFTLRDLTHEWLGPWVVVAAILIGAALSAFTSTQFAVASGAAFLVSEGFDMAVYAPLRERNWPLALLLSNTVGLLADSLIFLWLAFHSFAFLPGQIVGKLYMTGLALIVLAPARRRIRAMAVAA